MSEQDLVNSIIDYIHLKGGVATRINSGMVLVDRRLEGKQRVFRGAPAGTSDILACVNGRYIAIECKLPGNKPTDLQRDYLARVEEAGGFALVVSSIDDAITIIDNIMETTK